MATDLSQDSVLQFIRSVGGSVKNSELVQHYRNFIRDHADRDRNRELFKKFVNTVATVQQLDGVSFVVLRRKYKARVPPGDSGGGSPGPLRVPVGNNTEPSPERDRLNPSGRVEKTGQRAQQREVITPAPAGETAETTILPAAGVILNNNNTVETNLNLKQVTRPPDRPAENTPSLSEAHAQEQLTKVGQPRLGPGPPPGVTPVVRPSQLVPQPLRGREVYLPPGGGLRQEPPLRHISHRSEEPPLHHVSRHPQEPPLHHISHRTEEPPLHHISHRTEEPPLHHVSRHPQEPPLHHISHRSQEPPHHVSRHPQDPPLHHISHRSQEPPPHHVIRYPQEVPLYHGSHRSQEPPLHHFSRHPQEPPLHHFSRHPQEPPFHHISRHPWEPPLHHTSHHFQEPPLHHISRYPQKPPLHHAGRHPQEPPLHHAGRHSQEPPLHHAGRHSQEPPLHHAGRHSQEPPLHHVSRQPQLALQSEGGLRQEPPLHHINLHQEPPLHHTSRYPEVALQPEGDLHPEPPLHYISLHPQEPVLHHASPHPQEPPLHHASHQPQLALQSEGGLHQEPPLHHISLHQEPPLHHTSRDPEVTLQPEGDLHQEPPPHHTSRDPEVALQPDVDLQQGPPLHHASHHLQVALQPEESLHQDPPLHHTSHQPQVALQPEEGLHQDPPLHQTSHQPQVVLQPEEGLHQEPPPPHTSLQVAPRRVRHRQSYKSAVSSDDNEEEEEEEVPVRRGSAGGAWPLSTPLGDVSRAISTSSPCIIDQPMPPSEASSSSERKLPQIYIQDVKGEMRPPDEPSPDRNAQKDRRYSQPAGVQPEPRRGLDQSQKAGLSSSHISVFSQSSDAGVPSNDWPPPGSPTGPRRNSSYEDLLDRTGGSKIQEVLQRAQRTKLESETHHADSKTSVPWHHSTGHLHDDQESPAHLSPFHHSTGNLCDDQPRARALPWHLSTGDLYDHEETESSDGSTSSPPLRQRPGVTRRLSSQLRNRMCRSLGADLDQLLQEEARGEAGGGNEAARLNRLHMISSSLSLRYNLSSSSLSSCSTPPRCHSLADLAEGVEGKRGRRSVSTAHPEGSSRQSVVPLEAREHAWLVKGAAGAWPDIYSLFREDSTLLNRRDFISGFTVLHWIAKHGDHRVLNTLWYGVQKAGLTFDINARSTCGHTPLHIAAMHGHKNIMRLLVNKFNADVKLRDTAGKKPWQYLGCTTSVDVFQLLGAPPQAAVRAEGGVGRADSTRRPDTHQRRRRRHHFSSASGERPLTIAGTVRVKRSSSLAAFLKHKSMRRFHGHQSESSM